MTDAGYLALLLALVQPYIALSPQHKKVLARLFVVGGILLPTGIFLIHYVGLAYSPFPVIGWGSVLADSAGAMLIAALIGQAWGLWNWFRRGAGGGDELFFDVGGVGGETAEQVGGGGRGDGEAAVGAVDHAAAYVEWGTEPLDRTSGFNSCLIFYGVDAGGGGDDVDDGIDGAYFVEVDFFYGDVVDLCFACAEEFKGVDCGLLDCRSKGSGVDQVADDCEGATVGVFGSMLVIMGMSVGGVCFVEMLGFGVVLVGVGLLVVR